MRKPEPATVAETAVAPHDVAEAAISPPIDGAPEGEATPAPELPELEGVVDSMRRYLELEGVAIHYGGGLVIQRAPTPLTRDIGNAKRQAEDRVAIARAFQLRMLALLQAAG